MREGFSTTELVKLHLEHKLDFFFVKARKQYASHQYVQLFLQRQKRQDNESISNIKRAIKINCQTTKNISK